MLRADCRNRISSNIYHYAYSLYGGLLTHCLVVCMPTTRPNVFAEFMGTLWKDIELMIHQLYAQREKNPHSQFDRAHNCNRPIGQLCCYCCAFAQVLDRHLFVAIDLSHSTDFCLFTHLDIPSDVICSAVQCETGKNGVHTIFAKICIIRSFNRKYKYESARAHCRQFEWKFK